MNLLDVIANQLGTSSYVGVAALLFATGLGFPIPEEIILVVAGAAAYHGSMHVPGLVIVAMATIVSGDFAVYSMGRWGGRALLRWKIIRLLLRAERLDEVQKRYSGHLVRAVFTVRFISGLRAPTYFALGMLRMSAHKFVITDCTASLIHTPLFVLIGYAFSYKVDDIVIFLHRADRWMATTLIIAALLLAVYIGYRLGLHKVGKEDQ